MLELGAELVKEIRADDDRNTTGRWIAYYLAEKIEAAKTDITAEEECFDLILKLWQSKRTLPRGDPLARYNRILPLIEQVLHLEHRFFDELDFDRDTDDSLVSLVDSVTDLDRDFSSLLSLLLMRIAQQVSGQDNKLLELASKVENTPQNQFARWVVELGSQEIREEKSLDEQVRDAVEDWVAKLTAIRDQLV